MDELRLAVIDTPDCSVSSQFDELNEGDLSIASVSTSDFSKAISMLSKGDVDILAIPAELLHGKQMEMLAAGCEVVGARTPRRPNLVLVSDNKLDYQPRFAIILAESALVRRQLRRARGGLRVLSPAAFASISEQTFPSGDSLEVARWMESLRESGEIDGFITSRAVFDSIGSPARRHALLPDPKDRGGTHFLPLPYADLVILLARKRFPSSILKRFSEAEGEACWYIQDQMISGLDEEMLQRVGILVRHRQVRSLMKQAEEQRDLTLEQACHDTEGEVTEAELIDPDTNTAELTAFADEKAAKSGSDTPRLEELPDKPLWDAIALPLIGAVGVMLGGGIVEPRRKGAFSGSNEA